MVGCQGVVQLSEGDIDVDRVPGVDPVLPSTVHSIFGVSACKVSVAFNSY